MNKVFLIGNLTRDPETTTTAAGHVICKFAIAVQRNFTNANGEKEADFFNITAWRNLGELCSKWLEKGKKVAISGSIQIRNYESQDGAKKISVDITAEDVEFLTPRGAAGEQYENKPVAKQKVEQLEPMDDDSLPF